MDKIKVNNQVILMRKHVKQAKVRAINKLVKQVKLLQDRKGNEDQVQKSKKKAERYLKELEVMKKMKPDFVSKQALSKAADWKDILIRKTSTIEERSLALLASYDSVQKEVEKFYLSNPNLVSKISELIKQWEEKNKFINQVHTKKGKNEKSSKTHHLSDEKMFVEEPDSANEDQDIKPDRTESHSFTPNINKSKNKRLSLERRKNKKERMYSDVDLPHAENSEPDSASVTGDLHRGDENDNSEYSELDSNDANNNSESEVYKMTEGVENILNEKNSKDNCFETQVNKNNIFKSENNIKEFEERSFFQTSKPNKAVKIPQDSQKNDLKQIAVLNLAELDGLDEIPIENKTEDENSDIEASEKSSDPFFLKPGESPPVDYKKQLNLEKKNTGFVQQEGKKMNRYERRHGRPKHQFDSTKHSTDKKSFNKAGGFQARSRKELNSNSKNKKQFFPKGRNNYESKDKDTFKDFRRCLEKPDKPPFKRKETAFLEDKISHIKGKTSPDKPLHPSWEAKKKLKEVAHLPFQGKRTVFED